MPEATRPVDCRDTESSTFCNGCCCGRCGGTGCGGHGGHCGCCGAVCGGCNSCAGLGNCGSCPGYCSCCGSGYSCCSSLSGRGCAGGGRCHPWLVVLACFCLSFLVDGVASCFGVLLPELSAQIGATIAVTAWAGSALCGGQLIAGPLVSALVNKLGCRPVVIVGSLMSSVAFSLSASASEVGLFIVMYGIIGGLGLGMMYLPSVVAVSMYFDANRALATGIVVCGSGVGTFCLAPLTQYLLDESGWRGAQLATAALLLIGALLGSVMTEPPLYPDKRPPCCCCCCMGTKSTLSAAIPEEAGAVGLGSTARGRLQRPSAGEVTSRPSPVAAGGPRKTPEAVAPTDDAFLATSTGSYVKMVSPTVPSNAGDLYVDSPSPVDQATPPNVFLFPEVLVESASTVSVVDQEEEEENGPGSDAPEPAVPSQSTGAGGLIADGGRLVGRDPAASGSHLLLSPRRRLSRLSPVPSGRLLHVSDLLSPRPAVSTPHHLCRTPHHTPHSGGTPLSAHLRPLQRPDVFFSGRVRPSAVRRRCLPPGGVMASPSSPPSASAAPGCMDSDVQGRLALDSAGSTDATAITGVAPAEGEAGSSFAVMKEMLDLSLLRQIPFLLTCLGYALSMLGYFVPIVYILDEAVQHGVSHTRASLLVAVMGASNTVGRLLVGALSDLQHMDVLLLNNVSMLGSGLVALLFPFCHTYLAYTVTTAVFGLLAAANSTLSSLVLLEMVGLARLTNAFGLTLLFRGVAAVLGTPLAGFVAEQTGSYDRPFYMTGALLIVASVLGFLASAWGNRSCRARPDEDSNSYRPADSVDT